MKKIWKVVLSIVVFLLVGLSGTIYYFMEVKEYATNDEELNELISEEYEIILPEQANNKFDGSNSEGNSTTKIDDSANNSDQTNTTITESEQVGSDNNGELSNSDSANQNNKNATPKVETENKLVKVNSDTIIEKYKFYFNSLEGQANAKISSLLAYGKKEYQQKKANGDEISYFYFYNKYNNAAKVVENNTDKAFAIIYQALVEELEENGYSQAEAKQIKDHYNKSKKDRRSDLIKIAMEQF